MDTTTPHTSRPVGRPKGELSTVLNIRVPVALVAKLDWYLDRVTPYVGNPVNRATVMRRALEEFLERHAPDLL